MEISAEVFQIILKQEAYIQYLIKEVQAVPSGPVWENKKFFRKK